MIVRGRVWKYGDNVDTNVIIQGFYLDSHDPAELAKHCLEDIDPEFTHNVQPGDVIVAGENFGCGSSREHAPMAIQGAKVGCIIASSYARIFLRNAINIGLPILECAEAVHKIERGDTVEVDLATGVIRDLTNGVILTARPFPAFLQKIIAAGGLVNFAKQILAEPSK